jgi:lysophospholipid acyltransferase (LPLAT)-like uncharacterized protein
VHGQCAADRYDPELLAMLVNELADKRCRGSHSRAKNLVAALRISIVILGRENAVHHVDDMPPGYREMRCGLVIFGVCDRFWSAGAAGGDAVR